MTQVPAPRDGRAAVNGDEWSPGELARSVQRIEKGIGELRDEMRTHSANFATKEALQNLKDAHGAEIAGLRIDHGKLEARFNEQQTKAPIWPSILVGFTAVIGVVVSVITLLITH